MKYLGFEGEGQLGGVVLYMGGGTHLNMTMPRIVCFRHDVQFSGSSGSAVGWGCTGMPSLVMGTWSFSCELASWRASLPRMGFSFSFIVSAMMFVVSALGSE